MQNIFRICSLAICILILNCQSAFAKTELIEASGSYAIDLKMDETFASATALAREEAKRAATEKAGVYLQAYSKTVNLELDYDEVKTVAAQLLKIQDEKVSSKSLDNGLLEITVTIKALVEENDDAILKTIMSDKQKLEEATESYKKLQAEYDALKKQMDEYKHNYASANSSERKQIQKSVAQSNKYFEALLALENGNKFYFNGNYQQAISEYSRAINVKSNFAEAYNNRGNAYTKIQNYQQAMQDLQTAARLNNFDSRIHNNLGNVYLLQNNYNSAISEYSQAINLNPNLFTAYFNRALAYCYLNQFQSALPDAQRAMALNPTDADAKNLYDQIVRRV